MKPKKRCAKWCGRGCSKTEYDTAMRLAKRIARELGPDWKPVVAHNMGWYPRAASRCGRMNVSPSGSNYVAFLQDGRWVEDGKTPTIAARKVIRTAKKYLATLTAMLKDLPTIVGAP